ncbi:MAG: hypothetical protein MZV64_31540 [Ignavibacteriales bacterium]|nr:hypothetical protein [Ignavibacteriales bacterium]
MNIQHSLSWTAHAEQADVLRTQTGAGTRRISVATRTGRPSVTTLSRRTS